jgi:flagellar basal-body rod protein FlgF
VSSGYYAACAGLMAQTQALDIVANNLANLSTTAYHAEQPTFRSLLAGVQTAGTNPLNRALNDYGMLSGTRIDSSPGNLERTGNPLDLAIEGSAFFVIQTPAGVRYTRNGSFQVSTKGQLITSAGDPVMGDQGTIILPAGEVSISADGTISTAGAVAGKLKLVEFAPGTAPQAEGASYYSAPPKTVRPAAGSSVRQGMLEASNVNAVAGTVSLIVVQRQADMMERALSAYYNELDRVATADLPRIS